MKARPLPPGGTIGVAAPSSPVEQSSEIDRGIRWWESRGYRVRLAPGVKERDDYVAGDPRARADDLVTLFADPEIDVVQVLRGGYGCSEVVPTSTSTRSRPTRSRSWATRTSPSSTSRSASAPAS